MTLPTVVAISPSRTQPESRCCSLREASRPSGIQKYGTSSNRVVLTREYEHRGGDILRRRQVDPPENRALTDAGTERLPIRLSRRTGVPGRHVDRSDALFGPTG